MKDFLNNMDPGEKLLSLLALFGVIYEGIKLFVSNGYDIHCDEFSASKHDDK